MKVQLSNSGNKRLQLSTEPEEKKYYLATKTVQSFSSLLSFFIKDTGKVELMDCF